ncbi:VOC family protein [Pontivivens insulae]|uniref:Glyoxylase CFP32 n=1 Tax=Pontivivens insulae TaxID=1639689 RepID=A0A2R8AEM0_9RHOB|nr:VOC family protein [Pontivivens insulae]RED11791.1 hypothetical protein DFR53_2501 [Pontivivens insulae]SPF30548.1 Putative glyoxylase CFP32 [Pontivivens insulae]
MTDTHGTIHWTELATRDIETAKAFYADACGWTYAEMPMEGGGTYHCAMLGEQMICGLFDMKDEPLMADVPPHWATYLAVDDIDATCADAVKHGATVVRAPWDVPEVGRVAILMDPAGATIGLMTPS